MRIEVEPHPLLEARAFTTNWPRPLGEMPPLPRFDARLEGPEAPPFRTDDTTRAAIRDLLRHGGYRPTGRGKPAAEYLLRTAAEGRFPRINVAVDVLNLASLHSGLPISVIDLDRARAPFTIRLGREGERYVFNPAGQEIAVEGLLLLADAEGACANAVKDAQRTKTSDATRRTLSVVWGTKTLTGRAEEVARWYRASLEEAGADTGNCSLEASL